MVINNINSLINYTLLQGFTNTGRINFGRRLVIYVGSQYGTYFQNSGAKIL